VTSDTPRLVSVGLGEIRFLARGWPRHFLDEERVEDFAALYKEQGPEALPPLELVPVAPGRYLIGDGVHRCEGARRAGLTNVLARLVAPAADCDPVEFTYRYALGRSAISSLPLTRAEKRAAVRRLLEANPQASDREIGRLVGVDHKTVGRVRRGVSPPLSQMPELPPLGPTPEAVAKRLFRAFDKAYEARGLGIADFFTGDRTGERLAGVLVDVYGEQALKKTEQFRGWLDQAAKTLQEESR
jgi:ParB-like chromosome segregation protein Spo0J